MTKSGINLNADKKTMMEIRLEAPVAQPQIVLVSANIAIRVLRQEGKEDELVHLIDVITTNKTDFFREAGHFDYLTSKALPDLAARNGTGRKSLIWSAGCSTGEEPYTLAMVLSEYARNAPRFPVSVCWQPISAPPCWPKPAWAFSNQRWWPRCLGTFGESTSCAAAIRSRICFGSFPKCAP